MIVLSVTGNAEWNFHVGIKTVLVARFEVVSNVECQPVDSLGQGNTIIQRIRPTVAVRLAGSNGGPTVTILLSKLDTNSGGRSASGCVQNVRCYLSQSHFSR